MEDTHEVNNQVSPQAAVEVLILIVMEDTHEAIIGYSLRMNEFCLNPYCNGRYS